MSTVCANAPGKLLLAGEYVVLGGATAIAMAVNRRASVQVSIEDGTDHVVRSAGKPAASFRQEGTGLRFSSGREDYRLLESVWNAAAPSLLRARRFALDTGAFVDPETGVKLGIGSSAALTVALCAALLNDDTDPMGIAHTALQAHQAFQGGHGSGIDVAVACFGGVIEYHMEGMRIAPAVWPEGLEFAVLWSGVPVRTDEKLACYAGTPCDDTLLANAAERVAHGWTRHTVRDLMAAFADYVEALEKFSSDHELGVFEAGHAALVKSAPHFGVTYKPCGAGGGDVGVVLGTERDAVQAFAEDAARNGFMQLELAVDWEGVVRTGGET